MELTILGKYGPYPKAGGNCSSYLIRNGKNPNGGEKAVAKESAVCLDFGTGALSAVQKYVPLQSLDAIVLSHLHSDHMSDLLPLSYALSRIGKKLDLYLPFTDVPQFEMIKSTDAFCLKKISDGVRADIGGFSFEFSKMTHPIESYAMLVSSGNKTLLYSGDTSFNDALLSAAKRADLLLLDTGDAVNEKGKVHLSPQEALRLAKDVSAPCILTHLDPLCEYATDAENALIAEEGKTYFIQ